MSVDCKQCRRCYFNKPVSYFSKTSTWCRPCRTEYIRLDRLKNIIKYRESSKKCQKKIRINRPSWVCFLQYKNQAKKRDITFSIDYKQFQLYYGKECYYCGEINERNGLDRINNENGYFVDNLVSCCRMCNIMKNTQSLNGFISRCEKITRRTKIYEEDLY